MAGKPKVAVHKFASCSGCQLAFVNMGEDLIELATLVDLVHMAEVGSIAAEDEQVDIAFVEGSITTPHDVERLEKIRANSKYLITIGACATSGVSPRRAAWCWQRPGRSRAPWPGFTEL